MSTQEYRFSQTSTPHYTLVVVCRVLGEAEVTHLTSCSLQPVCNRTERRSAGASSFG